MCRTTQQNLRSLPIVSDLLVKEIDQVTDRSQLSKMHHSGLGNSTGVSSNSSQPTVKGIDYVYSPNQEGPRLGMCDP